MPTTTILFDAMKQLIKDAVSYSEFVAANSMLRDSTTLADLLARIDALNRGYTFERRSSDSFAVTGNTTINDNDRTIATAIEDPSPAVNSCAFNVYSPGAPFRLTGWSFTVLDDGGGIDLANVEVFYRDVTDPAADPLVTPWHELAQEDFTEPLTHVQIKVVIATLVSPMAIRRIVLLAEQI